MRLLLIVLSALLILACESFVPAAAPPTPEPTPDIRPAKTAIAQRTPIAPNINAPSLPTPTVEPTATPDPTPTPEPRSIDGLTKSQREAILSFNPATPTTPFFDSSPIQGIGKMEEQILLLFIAMGFEEQPMVVENGIRKTAAIKEDMTIIIGGPADTSQMPDKVCIIFNYHKTYPTLEIELLVSVVDRTIDTTWVSSLFQYSDEGRQLVEFSAEVGPFVITSEIIEEGLGVLFIVPK